MCREEAAEDRREERSQLPACTEELPTRPAPPRFKGRQRGLSENAVAPKSNTHTHTHTNTHSPLSPPQTVMWLFKVIRTLLTAARARGRTLSL